MAKNPKDLEIEVNKIKDKSSKNVFEQKVSVDSAPPMLMKQSISRFSLDELSKSLNLDNYDSMFNTGVNGEFYAIDTCFTVHHLKNKEKYQINTEKEKPKKLLMFDKDLGIDKSAEFKNISNFDKNSLLHLTLPNEFAYTGTIMGNNLHQGLLFSFVRHYSQWEKFIPRLCDVMAKLEPISSQLEDIQSEISKTKTIKTIQKLSQILKLHESWSKSVDLLTSTKSALVEAQKNIWTFIQENIKWDNYLAESEIFDDNIKVHFRVKDLEGNIQVMVLNVLNTCRQMMEVFKDKYQIKLISTIYFITWNEYIRQSHDSTLREENGIEADSYEIDIYFSDIELENKDKYRLNQEALEADKSILEICEFTSNGQIVNMPDEKCVKITQSKKSWLHIKMPDSEFTYTCAIMMNDARQGLLHSFLRHWDQWIEDCPDLQFMKKLEPIHIQLESIRNAPNHKTVRDAIDDLYTKIRSYNSETIDDIQTAFTVAQTKIHEILEKNIKSSKFVEEGVNFKNQILVYFELAVNKQEMVLGVSKQLFFPVKESDDKRPIRYIATVFFNQHKLSNQEIRQLAFTKLGLSWNEYQNPTITEARFGTKRTLRNVKIITGENFEDLDFEFENGEPNDNNNFRAYRDLITSKSLLHVKMPYYFGHTCAVMTNSIYGGLLHIIARHSDEWANNIRGFANLTDNLDLIRNIFNQIRDARNEDEKNTAYNNYNNFYRNELGEANLLSIRKLQWFLLKAQMRIYRFIQSYVMIGDYCGERKNESDQIQIIFSVPRHILLGNRVQNRMAVCVSDEYYPPLKDAFCDHRHFRTIITVFFGNYNQSQLDVTWRPTVCCSNG